MRLVTAASVLATVLLGAGLLFAEDEPRPNESTEEPLDLGIQEQTERRLAQIDVAVTGPSEVIGRLTAADFELFVGNIALGGKAFEPIFADRICPAVQLPEDATAPASDVGAAAAQRVQYVFFFDQSHLTYVGRARALVMARELVETLVTDGSSGTIISTSRQLATYARNTMDPEELLRALDELEQDPEQVDSYGENMENRLRLVFQWRRGNEITRRYGAGKYGSLRRFEQGLAYQFQKEAIVEASRSLRRLSMVLRSQAEFRPPKVLFYFADTMISRPGQIYIQVANLVTNYRGQGARQHTDTGPVDPWAAVEPFEAVLQDAAASGVRLFPIQAEGLVQRRFRTPAKHSLGSMAKKTGGEHFINGVAPTVIADRVQDELGCIYLLSFDPAGLSEDQRHDVIVSVRHPKVRINAPSLMLLRSMEGDREAELVAAFTAPDTTGIRQSLSGVLMPIGFHDGKYSALFQMRVPESTSLDAVWDLGFSILWRDAVRESSQRRVTVAHGSTAVVLESVVDIGLSDFELMMVAQEQATNSVLTGHLTDRWPDPRDAPVSVSSVQAVQAVDAYFVRDEETRSGGSLGLANDASIRSDRDVTILALVCRDPQTRAATLQVEHRLSGVIGLKLPLENLELSKGQRCGLVRETIPVGHLSSGELGCTITVTDANGRTAQATRRFNVGDGADRERLVTH